MGVNDGGQSGFDGGDYDSEPEFSAGSIVGPLLGALAGAVTWAIIACYFRVDIGWGAWAVGGLIGLCARAGGTPGGIETGVFCALLTILTIGAGKVGAVKLIPESSIREAAYERFDREAYELKMAESRSYVKLNTSDDEVVRDWMFGNGYYAEAESSDAITEENVEAFKAGAGSQLQHWAGTSPAFEEWASEMADSAVEAAGNVTMKDALVASVGLFDIAFIFLGVTTAFTLGGRLKV